MAAVDTARVNSVVFAMSKDSLHFRHQQKLADDTSRRIQAIQGRIQTLRNEPPSYLAHLNQRAAHLLTSYESQRDLSHTWLHIDLDFFYAAVHLKQPAYQHLRDKPVAVGNMSKICTSNYVARQYGVRSAIPGFIALKLCPQLHFISPDYRQYKAIAAVFRAIFAQYDPIFESASLDEAYLDITALLAAKQAQQPAEQSWDKDREAEEVAAEIRQRVFEATQLTCSAGVACNHMLAKIATDYNKPNGQYLVPTNLPAILSFISPLPVRKVAGIGKVLERTLNAIGVHTVGQMRDEQYRALLVGCFSELTYGWLFRVALGLGRVEHENDDERQRKSVSTERTFRDLSSYAELSSKADEIACRLFDDLQRKGGVKGRTLTLKLKTAAFEVKQHSVSVEKGLWIHKLEDVRRLGLQLPKAELNLLLTSKKLKRAALKEAEKTGGGAAAAVSAALFGAGGSDKASVGSPFDGLMRIRLMGLRLSALYVDETGEADDESVGDGEQGAGGSSVKKRGGMSILKFAKRLDSAEQEAIVDDSRAEQQSSKRWKAEVDNNDISRYFDVTSPSKALTPAQSDQTFEAVRRKGSGSRRNIESYFSLSTATADGAEGVHSFDDDVVKDEREANEWMKLMQDAAEASGDQPFASNKSPLAPTATAVSFGQPTASQQLTVVQSLPSPSSAVALAAASSLPPYTAFPATPPSSLPAAVVAVLCPVCGRDLGGGEGAAVSNLALNSHLDTCLRGNAPSSLATDALEKQPTSRKASASGGRVRGGREGGGNGVGGGRRAAQARRPVSLVELWKRKDC